MPVFWIRELLERPYLRTTMRTVCSRAACQISPLRIVRSVCGLVAKACVSFVLAAHRSTRPRRQVLRSVNTVDSHGYVRPDSPDICGVIIVSTRSTVKLQIIVAAMMSNCDSGKLCRLRIESPDSAGKQAPGTEQIALRVSTSMSVIPEVKCRAQSSWVCLSDTRPPSLIVYLDASVYAQT